MRSTLAGALLLSACCTPMQTPPPTVPPPTPCPVAPGSHWRAIVDAMPGPERHPALVVAGTVGLPYGGWRVRLADPRPAVEDRRALSVELVATPPREPEGPAQGLAVRGSWPATLPITALVVSCRGTTLARIAPVEIGL